MSWRPVYIGVGYCVAGVMVGAGAANVEGWPAVLIWFMAVVLFLAGLWTVLFMGFWLGLLRKISRDYPSEVE